MKKRYSENRPGGEKAPPAASDTGVALPAEDTENAVPEEAVFRDIVRKAAEGNIKYQELYLKYIDLIAEKMVDEDEVVYEAVFIDDEDQEA